MEKIGRKSRYFLPKISDKYLGNICNYHIFIRHCARQSYTTHLIEAGVNNEINSERDLGRQNI